MTAMRSIVAVGMCRLGLKVWAAMALKNRVAFLISFAFALFLIIISLQTPTAAYKVGSELWRTRRAALLPRRRGRGGGEGSGGIIGGPSCVVADGAGRAYPPPKKKSRADWHEEPRPLI